MLLIVANTYLLLLLLYVSGIPILAVSGCMHTMLATVPCTYFFLIFDPLIFTFLKLPIYSLIQYKHHW